MRAKKTTGIITVGMFLAAGLAGSALRADNNADPEKKAVVAIQAPMEIPGSVLQPGSYVFKQSGSQTAGPSCRSTTKANRRWSLR